MGKIDKYTIAAIFIIAFIVMFTQINKGKFFVSGFVISGLASIYFGLSARRSPAKIVMNDFDQEVFLLPETGSGIEVCKPGELKSGFDGLATKFDREKVYKAYNGTHVRITREGKILTYSPVTGIFSPGYVLPGYFKKDEFKKWAPLFDAAKKA